MHIKLISKFWSCTVEILPLSVHPVGLGVPQVLDDIVDVLSGSKQVDQVLSAGAEGGLKLGPEARALFRVKRHALGLLQAGAPHLGGRQSLGARQVDTPDLQQRRLELTKALRRQRDSNERDREKPAHKVCHNCNETYGTHLIN